MTAEIPDSKHSQFPPSVHAYCASSAVCLSFATDRRSNPTVTVEFASASDSRKYDWANKVAFQLTRNELAELTAYMFYPSALFRWVHTSPAGVTKGFEVRLQSPVILFSISSRSRSVRTPVTPTDQYFVRNLLMSRLTALQPDLAPEMHLASLKRLAANLSSRQ